MKQFFYVLGVFSPWPQKSQAPLHKCNTGIHKILYTIRQIVTLIKHQSPHRIDGHHRNWLHDEENCIEEFEEHLGNKKKRKPNKTQTQKVAKLTCDYIQCSKTLITLFIFFYQVKNMEIFSKKRDTKRVTNSFYGLILLRR